MTEVKNKISSSRKSDVVINILTTEKMYVVVAKETTKKASIQPDEIFI